MIMTPIPYYYNVRCSREPKHYYCIYSFNESNIKKYYLFFFHLFILSKLTQCLVLFYTINDNFIFTYQQKLCILKISNSYIKNNIILIILHNTLIKVKISKDVSISSYKIF